MTFGGLESGPIFPEIIEIGAGKNLRVDVARDAAIKIGLAEETAINRIGQIVFIREFSRVDDLEAPSLVAASNSTRSVASSGTAGEKA